MSSHSPYRRHVHDMGDLDAEELDGLVEPEALPDRAPDGVRRRSYDKAFEPAVARGLLTVQAAWARGSREAYAIGLQRRYHLTSTLALEVADNSMSLLDALEILDRQSGGALSELAGTRVRLYSRLVPVGLIVAGILILVGQFAARLWEEQSRTGRQLEQLSLALSARPQAAPAKREPAESSEVQLTVERDKQGRVTQVSGGKPGAVLDEICRMASPSGTCAWKQVRHSEPHQPSLRVGRFTAQPDDPEVWSVLIRRTRRSGLWTAGTGLQPLQPFPSEDAGRHLAVETRAAIAAISAR